MPTDSLTDLLGGVIIIPMLFIIAYLHTEKKAEKKYWLAVFSLLSASCIIGFIAHYYCEPYSRLAFYIIWILLYPLMAETVNFFFFLAMCIKLNRSASKKIFLAVHIISIAVTVFSLISMWLIPETDIDIKVFNVYAALTVIAGFGFIFLSAFRDKNKGSLLIFGSLIPLVPAVYFQLERKTVIRIIWEFDYNAITHIFIIICEFVLFFAAIYRLKKTMPADRKGEIRGDQRWSSC